VGWKLVAEWTTIVSIDARCVMRGGEGTTMGGRSERWTGKRHSKSGVWGTFETKEKPLKINRQWGLAIWKEGICKWRRACEGR